MKVFISGSRSITELNDDITSRLYSELNSDANILVGDAAGIDSEVQKFCKINGYMNVTVFAMNGKARNNLGGFNVINILPGDAFNRNFFVEKDKAMTDLADYGIVIWDGKSKGSLDNIYRLVRQNKLCQVYLMPEKKWITVEDDNFRYDKAANYSYTAMQLSMLNI